MKNYYNILEVNPNASTEVIEKAYKVLVKKYHPDLRGNTQEAEKKIKEINEAYDVLSDDFLKEQYDKELQRELNKSNNNFQESDYGRLYKEKERLKYQLAHEKREKTRVADTKRQESQNVQKDNSPSAGIIELLKEMFSYMPKISDVKNIKRIDILAFILTVAVILFIGAILYLIPFTHDWMNKNFIDTPLINWIKELF